ncbi:MAG: PSD1 and planctomycete cytochrome C domain-containing protein [Pirellulaceae bacterium]
MLLRCVFVAIALPGSWAVPVGAQQPEIEHFEKEIRPLLIAKCAECHSGSTPDGDLNLVTKKGFQAGGTSGELMDGTDLEFSLLYQRVITTDENAMMPPDERLNEKEIEAIKQWILAGAVWPDSPGEIDPASDDQNASANKHWSFQPRLDSVVPDVEGDHWSINAIDRFVLEKLRASGLQPVVDADPAVWLRRITLKLTGLPPTLEEQQGFASDDSEHARSRVIERLLSSRAYAERQGRQWLDVARYADTSGDGTDTPIPEARYYRDWVIDAFDNDMPYDQFLIDQIAGDVLAAEQPDADDAYRKVIATGYIALSRRFGNSKFAQMHQIIDDTIDTIGKSTMALSLGCARCHHHKFDPVTTEDYYGLYGYFASTQYPHAGTEHQKDRSDMPSLVIPADRADQFESHVAWGVSDQAKPADAKIHLAGDPSRKGEIAPRSFLAFLNDSKPRIPDGQSGRLQLARWIASPENPLTSRVMVNRIWQSHFGTGLVADASNFGVQTAEPVHRELLDYLAGEFIDSGWSVKHVHRLIVSSRLYRLSSQGTAEGLRQDEANQLLWRFPRTRMDAETFRDSMLLVSDQLRRGNNGRHPFKPTEQLKYNQGRPFDEIYDHNFRSVYLMTPRLNRHPMMALFDAADANVTTGKRGESTVPLQSLFVINGEFVARQANAFSQRYVNLSDREERLRAMWQMSLSRPVEEWELKSAIEFIENFTAQRVAEGDTAEQASDQAWTSVARTLLASNEFIYID